MIQEWLTKQNISFEVDTRLSTKTWIKTGGVCSCWIMPNSAQQLAEVCKFLYSNKLNFDIVGQTSNIFFHSSYNPEIVISTVKVNQYVIENNIITCECGVSVAKMSRDCLALGYAGFYGLVGLPGTVASSVYGNAGCFDCSITSMLVSVEVLFPAGDIKTLTKEELGLSHRSSVFKRKEIQGVILSVKLKVEKANDLQEEMRKSEATVVYRKTKQEKPNWCLGSVFANLKTHSNWKNKMAGFLSRLIGKLKLSPQKKAYKKILLRFYGYADLNPYVSDKNLNTFIWRDEKAERMFEKYKLFMSEVHKALSIEIEERK